MRSPTAFDRLAHLEEHLAASRAALRELEAQIAEIDRWSAALVDVLGGGGRLLVAGNGGSAALAAHLVAELVGRFRDERPPASAIALHAETATFSALGNDYGYEEVFARQVAAHGRDGDVLLSLSTSGRSPNLLRAVSRAEALGVTTWALTGPAPNPLAEVVQRALCIGAPNTAAVQDAHQVAVHLLCIGYDDRLAASTLSGHHPRVTARPPRRPTSAEAARRLAVLPEQTG
jgi:D-sedoheptulose 7-phosphate isomerase